MAVDVDPAERLIVALDVDTYDQASTLVDKLGDSVRFYKVGWQLFFGSHFDFINELARRKKKIFLDLKMEDIGTTIQQALRNAPAESVDFLELMTLKGASSLVHAARQGVRNGRLKFLMLTVLSSLDNEDMRELFGPDATIDKIVQHRAEKALAARCEGLIASGGSVRKLRGLFGDDFMIVAPGIRPKGLERDDHKRVLTPFEAIRDGADFIVVGRPIRDADDPLGAAAAIIEEIKRGLDERARSTPSHGGHKEDFSNLLNAAVGGAPR